MTFVGGVDRAPGRSAWRMRLYDLAEFHGWRCHMLGADWGPDLIAIRRTRLLWIFAETERNRLSSERLARSVELRDCRQDVVIWRPADGDKIDRILR